jgi:haloalkane dehalogenase
VSELLAPSGTVFVLQSFSRIVDADPSVEQLPALGERLQLSEGWQYRLRTLHRNPVVGACGDAHIVFDEYERNCQREDG